MIEVENLGFTYPHADNPTLQNVNFTIKKGEVFGLLGPSGAGKSTAQRVMMRLLTGHTGTVKMLGKPIEQLGRDLYNKIGVCFELPALYLRLTARENLKLFAALYDRPTMSIEKCLELVDLLEDADKRVESFSKGMKMRLNLCRSLLHEPDILFFDEPTSGQDPARARITRDLIKSLKAQGKTIFLTTHNMAEADEVCDKVGFLHNGTIVKQGAPAVLKQQFGTRSLKVTTGFEKMDNVYDFPMENIGRNQDFLELMHNDNILSLHTQEASLDDVFIKLVQN